MNCPNPADDILIAMMKRRIRIMRMLGYREYKARVTFYKRVIKSLMDQYRCNEIEALYYAHIETDNQIGAAAQSMIVAAALDLISEAAKDEVKQATERLRRFHLNAKLLPAVLVGGIEYREGHGHG